MTCKASRVLRSVDRLSQPYYVGGAHYVEGPRSVTSRL